MTKKEKDNLNEIFLSVESLVEEMIKDFNISDHYFQELSKIKWNLFYSIK